MSNFLGSRSASLRARISAVDRIDLVILALFGCCQVGLGFTLFSLGSRFLPSGQATLISTLETPLMPFWVWLAIWRSIRRCARSPAARW